MSTISINIKTVTGDKHVVEASPSATVTELKEIVSGKTSIPVAQIKLIFAGQVLKDARTIDSYGIKDTFTVHLVKSAGAQPTTTTPTPSTPTSTSASTTPSAPTTQTTPPAANPFANPFAPGAAGAPGGNLFSTSISQMQQQLAQNPNLMREMLNSPLTQQLLQNPELMRMMLTSNPQMREIIERNPEIGHLLNDPQTLRQTLELARNPELMREMMRTSDRAIGNLESVPGGFDFLRRMYTNVQEPLLNAAVPPQQQPEDTAAPSTPLTVPNNTPLPNPWDPTSRGSASNTSAPTTTPSGGAAATTNPAAADPFAANPFAANPFSMFGGGAGSGAGAAPFGMPDPATMNQMMNNPQFQSMMQNMVQNPEMMNMMEQMVLNNPHMQQMYETNPELRALTPEIIRMMANPQVMQSMMQNASAFGGSPFSQFGGFPEAGAQLPGSVPTAAPSAPVSQEPPEQRYRVQLQHLRDMGFENTQLNIELLQQYNGDVNRTLDRLFGL